MCSPCRQHELGKILTDLHVGNVEFAAGQCAVDIALHLPRLILQPALNLTPTTSDTPTSTFIPFQRLPVNGNERNAGKPTCRTFEIY